MGKVKSYFWDLLMKDGAEILKDFGAYAEVCVPEDWPDEAILAFAEEEMPNSQDFEWEVADARQPIRPGYISTQVLMKA